MPGQERLEVTRVLPGARPEPALVALLATITLIGAAVWKPWAGAADAPPRPSLAHVEGMPSVGVLPPAASAPEPTSDSAVLAVTGDPPIAGLNLAAIGLADRHNGWGVAAAYVPITRIAAAARKRLPSVTPVVEWKAADRTATEPGRLVEIPGASEAIETVALAVTWPSPISPRDIRLFYGRVVEIPLLRPLPGIAMRPWQAGGGAVDTSDAVWSRASGVFYLPPSEPLPTRPRDWLRRGWPPGSYQFHVRTSGGIRIVPFLLRGDS